MRQFLLEDRARRMAKKMVYLEGESKRAMAGNKPELALALWTARMEILDGRMLLTRRLWALRRTRYDS